MSRQPKRQAQPTVARPKQQQQPQQRAQPRAPAPYRPPQLQQQQRPQSSRQLNAGAKAFVPSSAYKTQVSNNMTQALLAGPVDESAQYIKQLLCPEEGPLVGIPDTNTNAFSVWRTTAKYAVTTDAFGAVYLQIIPNVPQHLATYGSAAGVWGAPAYLPHAQAGALQANSMNIRPVAMAAKFTGTGALSTSTGDVLVGVHGSAANNFIVGSSVASSQNLLSRWKRCSAAEAIDKGCRVVWFPRDPNDNVFLAATAGSITTSTTLGTNAGNNHDYNTLAVVIEGAAAATLVGQLETVTIWEATPVPGSAFLTRQTTLANAVSLDAAAVVAATVSPIRPQPDMTTEAKPSVMQEVLSFGKSIAPAVLDLLALVL